MKVVAASPLRPSATILRSKHRKHALRRRLFVDHDREREARQQRGHLLQQHVRTRRTQRLLRPQTRLVAAVRRVRHRADKVSDEPVLRVVLPVVRLTQPVFAVLRCEGDGGGIAAAVAVHPFRPTPRRAHPAHRVVAVAHGTPAHHQQHRHVAPDVDEVLGSLQLPPEAVPPRVAQPVVVADGCVACSRRRHRAQQGRQRRWVQRADGAGGPVVRQPLDGQADAAADRLLDDAQRLRRQPQRVEKAAQRPRRVLVARRLRRLDHAEQRLLRRQHLVRKRRHTLQEPLLLRGARRQLRQHRHPGRLRVERLGDRRRLRLRLRQGRRVAFGGQRAAGASVLSVGGGCRLAHGLQARGPAGRGAVAGRDGGLEGGDVLQGCRDAGFDGGEVCRLRGGGGAGGAGVGRCCVGLGVAGAAPLFAAHQKKKRGKEPSHTPPPPPPLPMKYRYCSFY
eukprot:Rhum_TRINITY_DN12000_c0_g2::Rhum_TRINITY_DN12000_c0_g2_i1::g.48533::m.48533